MTKIVDPKPSQVQLPREPVDRGVPTRAEEPGTLIPQQASGDNQRPRLVDLSRELEV